MTLTFLKQFPWGADTNFATKIIIGLMGSGYIKDVDDLMQYAQYDQYMPDSNAKTSTITLKKVHTIRADEKNRWRKGRLIHFKQWYNTPYRSMLNQFAPKVVVRLCQCIEIDYTSLPECEKPIIVIDGKHFYNPLLAIDNGLETLAQNDGFDSIDDFFKYFNTDFKGKIIHWTDLRY